MAAIVHNSGINYSLYYNILNYFKTIMTNHPSIMMVSQGALSDFDYDEFPNYPVGNVVILNANWGTSTTDYQIQLIVADKVKNKNNESDPTNNEITIPFYKRDDLVDIHANTFSILNDLTSYTQRGVVGFEINSTIELKAFSDEYNNGLAGWIATFQLTTHNNRDRCLFDLLIPIGSAGYVIRNCDTQTEYNVILNESGSVGQVFATSFVPFDVSTTTYSSLGCYTIISTFDKKSDIDYYGLPIIAFPYTNFETCNYCKQWTTPQIWNTTPQNWNSGSNAAFRLWSTD